MRRASDILGRVARSQRARRGTARLRAVALIGIDGSGKTTQAHRLADALTRAGLPATYHRNAGGRAWLGHLAQRVGRRDAQALVGRRGMLTVESVLRWLAITRALLTALVSGRTAVMDRYAVCQYASIRAHGGRPGTASGGSPGERLARLAYRLFPAPQVTILLTVDPAEAYRRIERRGTDHEPIGYLAAADAAYRSLPEFPTFVLVDANGPPDEVARRIHAHLAAWLPATGAGVPTPRPPLRTPLPATAAVLPAPTAAP
ncbi:dTMP kinase [Micromonospora sp. WMMD882]|uniref:dTMP kinase n=1 Tax=Micromonospora sp. WMMD882 TaxID=3015151 RepID=UPI00248BD16C|nr:dTMP kinase [Micromonospora sp. WMMD882]WBB79529.1 dTMP kinase [Micromonospora sp. WMMD882]